MPKTKIIEQEDRAFLLELGQRLRRLRLSLKLTQNEVAVRASTNRSYYSKIERGAVSLSVARLRRISIALGDTSITEIMTHVEGKATLISKSSTSV